MGWRKSGAFREPEEVLILTCDVCECDIGNEDGRRPFPYLRLTRHPNAGGMDDQDPATILCSRDCLSAYAAKLTDLNRTPPAPRR
jgi:hypothetical protein